MVTTRSKQEPAPAKPEKQNKREAADDAEDGKPPLKQAKLDTMVDRKEPEDKKEDEAAKEETIDEAKEDLLGKVDDAELEKAEAALDEQDEVISHGKIYFLYKPKVALEAAHSIDDVSRLHIILRPETPDDDKLKLIIVGRKYLPDPEHSRQPIWAFTKEVTEDSADLLDHVKRSSYSTKTRGERTVSEDRVFGEGHYALVVQKGDIPSKTSSHLAYVLELPDEPGTVQDAFNLKAEGSFGLSVKNPKTGNPPGGGLRTKDKAEYPQELQDKFEGRRWNPITEIGFLNTANAELLLLAQKENVPSNVEDELHTLAADDAEHSNKAPRVMSARIYEDLRAKTSKKEVNTQAVSGEWA